MAVGEIGLSVDEFYDLTFDDFGHVLDGYYKKLNRDYRNGWEQSRFVAYHLLLPHQKKGKSFKPKDIITFEWEKEETKEAIEKLRKVDMDSLFPKTIKG